MFSSLEVHRRMGQGCLSPATIIHSRRHFAEPDLSETRPFQPSPAQNQPDTILESQPDSEISADQVSIDLTDGDDDPHRSSNRTVLQTHDDLVQAASAGKALAAATGGKRTPEKN